MKEIIEEQGLGTYYIGAYVRLLETPDKPVSVDLGVQVLGDSIAWPMTLKNVVIHDTEWHFIGGNITINQTGITSVTNFAEALYDGQTGDAGAYLGDMEWDAFTFCRVDNSGNHGENLFVNPNANIDESGNVSGWGKNQEFTMTSSLMPGLGGGALHVTDRSSNTSGPSQDITEALINSGSGTYLYSAYVRLVKAPAAAQNVSIGVELTNGGEGVAWPQSVASVGDTQWHRVSGTISIGGGFDRAVTFVNTFEEGGAACDIEIDAVFLAKQGADGLYGENLIKNPTMEYDELGATSDWGLYRTATLTNTEYALSLLPDGGVDNPDGSVTYAKGLVPADDKNIVYAGRWTDTGDNGKQVAFEGYAEIRFTGTSLRVLTPTSGSVYVEIDGVLSHKLVALTASAVIASGLSDGEHTVKLFAQAQQSLFTIGGFAIDQGAKTLPIETPKRIEFIGDSISEGYVDARNKLSDLENNSYLNSFTLKTGRMLNQEYGWSFNTVAFGGIGLVLTESPDPLTMGERYFTQREYLPSDGTGKADALQAAGAYDAVKYVPDYIVINLGTNDANKNIQIFKENYISFITKLQETYPNVTIFCMTPFNGAKRVQIKEVVNAFDSGVYLIDSAQWGISGGADGLHPAPASLNKAAEKLFKELKEYVDNSQALEPETNAPETSAPETNAATDTPTDTVDPAGDTTGDHQTTERGCTSVIGMSAAFVLAAVIAFVALKKKD